MQISAHEFARLKRKYQFKMFIVNEDLPLLYPRYIKHQSYYFQGFVEQYLKHKNVRAIWESKEIVVIQFVS